MTAVHFCVAGSRVVARNLARRLRSEPLEEYRAQREWLSLMNTRDGRASMCHHGAAVLGSPLWWLTDRHDRRFVDRFQRRER